MNRYTYFDTDGDMVTMLEDGRGKRRVLSRNGVWEDDGYDWVNKSHPSFRRTKRDYPYSYSEFYHWRDGEPSEHAVYSDRLSQWSNENWNRAWEALRAETKRFEHFTKKDASKFLSAYWAKKIECTALAEGCNVGNGYPYFIFWYKELSA